jgi:hypothetical protein
MQYFATECFEMFRFVAFTPDAKNAINLVAENWVFWLFMMIAGIIVGRAKSNWKFLFAALFAVLPLLALPGSYHTDEQRGLIHAGFALIGFILGATSVPTLTD